MYLFESSIKIGELGESEKEVLVIFSGQLEGDRIVYSELLERKLRNFPNKPEEVLFIYPNYIDDAIKVFFRVDEKCYANIIRYGKHIPVTFLAFDKSGEFQSYAVNARSAVCDDLIELRKQIVDRGLYNLAKARKDQVILQAPSGTIFIKPSKHEFHEFIKASELAIGYAENQFIAFCLLSKAPRNKSIKRIYIDTNSISSFVEALLFYWMRFSNSKCRTAIYESYGSYEGIENNWPKPELTEDVWVLISASTTNSLGVKIAQEWSLDNDQVLTLLSYAETHEDKIGDEILVNIVTLSRAAKKVLSEGSVIKVKVWGENFTAEVEKPNRVYIKAAHKTKAVTSLILPNKSNNLILCNKKINSDYPVSSVYIDTNDYFSSDDKFNNWLKDIVDWYVPPKVGWLVYQSIDQASTTLVQIVEKLLHRNGIKNFEKIDIVNARKDIKGNDSVVVVMPVTGSGQTLLKLNRNLRISGHKGNRIFISPFVAASSKTSYEQFHNSLVYGPNGMKYSFHAWKYVFIGHSDNTNSWQKELVVVESFEAESEFWRHRANILRAQNLGLKGAIGTPSIEKGVHLTFTADFAFWGVYQPEVVNPEAVYLTISSILQGLRERPYMEIDKNSLFSYVYQHSVIAPENFTRFTDALLQSCLWRASNAREMDYRSDRALSEEFSSILERLIDENSSGTENAAVDLLMGIATGKIQLETGALSQLIERATQYYEGKNENAILLIEYIKTNWLPSYSSSEIEKLPL